MRKGVTSLLALTLTLFLVVLPRPAHAFLELNGLYFNDGLTSGNPAVNTNRLFFDICLGFEIDRSAHYLVGWDYSIQNISNAMDGKTVTYASTQMGPRFVFNFDRNHSWSFGLGYYLVTKATYNDGTDSAANLSGTALRVDFGYAFPISENFLLGARLNYSRATYSQSLTGANYASVSDVHTAIFPSIYSIWLF